MKAWKDYIGVWIWWLIVNDDWKILLMKRWPKSKNEIWYRCQPWWAVEFGETLEQAVLREVKEETNLDVEILYMTSITDHIIQEENQHRVSISYLVKYVWWELQNTELWKIEELKWFDLNQLPKLISPPTLNNINAYKKLKNNI